MSNIICVAMTQFRLDGMGTLADWANVIVTFISIIVSGIALWFAFNANKIAKESKEQSSTAEQRNEERWQEERAKMEERQRQELKKAEEQERQRIANSLQAWWAAKHGSSEGAQWGIVLCNEGEVSAVFYNLRITLVIKDTTHTIDCKVVPPGRFFIACNLDRQNTIFPEPIKSEYTYEPIMRSSKHEITAMYFQDRTGTTWHWTPGAGAEKLSNHHA